MRYDNITVLFHMCVCVERSVNVAANRYKFCEIVKRDSDFQVSIN